MDIFLMPGFYIYLLILICKVVYIYCKLRWR